MQSERFKNGLKKLEEMIGGDAEETVYGRLNAISPFMARYLVESFGEVCALPQIGNRGETDSHSAQSQLRV